MAKIPGKKWIMKLEDQFIKGKYVGFTLEKVLEQDPNYVHWLVEQMGSLELDNEAFEYYLKRMQEMEADN